MVFLLLRTSGVHPFSLGAFNRDSGLLGGKSYNLRFIFAEQKGFHLPSLVFFGAGFPWYPCHYPYLFC